MHCFAQRWSVFSMRGRPVRQGIFRCCSGLALQNRVRADFMRVFCALLLWLNLTCGYAALLEYVHPWEIVGDSHPVEMLGISKIEWVAVDRGILFSEFKTYVFDSKAEIEAGINRLRRLAKMDGGERPISSAFSEAGYVVFRNPWQDVTLHTEYANQEKWWTLLYYQEGDTFSASVQMGRDADGSIHEWFENPARLAHTRHYPNRWLFWFFGIAVFFWLLKTICSLCLRWIRRLRKRGTKNAGSIA